MQLYLCGALVLGQENLFHLFADIYLIIYFV